MFVFFFLERRTAMKPVKIKTIQSQAKCCISLRFFFFFGHVILFVEFRNQIVSHQQPNEKAPIYFLFLVKKDTRL